MRVVYLGTRGPLALRPFEAILASGHEVRGVVLPSPRAKSAMSLEPPISPAGSELPVWDPCLHPSLASVAAKHGVPVFRARRLSGAEGIRVLEDLGPDVLCVSCFPEIVSDEVLGTARLGGFNVHPSLLPKYRGPSPLFWLFRSGERHAGVTVHRMTSRPDAGPIAAQAGFVVPDGCTWEALEALCSEIAASLVTETLDRLERGSLTESVQDESAASWFGFPVPADYRIDATMPVRRAFNFVRGVATPERAVEIVLEDRTLSLTGVAGFAEGLASLASRPAGDGGIQIPFVDGVLFARASEVHEARLPPSTGTEMSK